MKKAYERDNQSYVFGWLAKLLPTLLFSVALSFGTYAQAQSQLVKGKIKDAMGIELPGVTVAVKGTKLNAMTNENGDFSIAASNGAVLTISYIGFVSREVTVTGSAPLTIVLQEAPVTLDDVVVVGYSTARKKDLTGAITQIKPDKIADENPRTVQDILRGTPGLTIGLDASAKNGGNINIRGQRSLRAGNSPMLVPLMMKPDQSGSPYNPIIPISAAGLIVIQMKWDRLR